MKAEPDSGHPPSRNSLPAPLPGPEIFIKTLRIEFPALIHCPPGMICVAMIGRAPTPARGHSRYSALKAAVLSS